MASQTADVVLVGGGVIGLSLAWELAGQGARVAVVEQGDFGREASWAGAGMLPPGNLARAATPEALIRGLSASLWPEWSAALSESTGVDNGFRRCEAVGIVEREGHVREVRAWQAEGVDVRALSRADLQTLEPALNRDLAGGYLLPDFCQVRNPRHVKALVAACGGRGVQLHANLPVLAIERSGQRVTGVRTAAGTIAAGSVCVTSGAWSRSVLEGAGILVPVEPVRGQIVLLSQQPSPLRRVIEWGARYLVPRGDGRILVGSTEERVGFNRSTTAQGISQLIDFARHVAPALGAAHVERCWAGLRPGSPDGLPLLGRVGDAENLFVAAGHYRNGLQMSPGTARVMRQLVLGQPPEIALEGFAPDRTFA